MPRSTTRTSAVVPSSDTLTSGIGCAMVVELALVEPGCAVAAEEFPHAGSAVVDALPGDIDLRRQVANRSAMSSYIPRSR